MSRGRFFEAGLKDSWDALVKPLKAFCLVCFMFCL